MERRGTKTELGWLLLRAMDERGASVGKNYGYRELGEESGYEHSSIARVVKGQRNPSRRMVVDLAHALRPFLDEREALVAAGYLPDDARTRAIVREVVRAPQRASRERTRINSGTRSPSSFFGPAATCSASNCCLDTAGSI